ncbi:PrsW family intramembrane metalloprotease [Arcanobacterium urinimassiliense]|uniref:PrsW family intramembrane metalloprotease n=1 Tax=Arcanobacterium urinimassiliense TaxID=1871014 RepID=UPI00093AC46B|nr:PrsW family intramembrane metalloprotease [Arcanobacterium urinimassiliense]
MIDNMEAEREFPWRKKISKRGRAFGYSGLATVGILLSGWAFIYLFPFIVGRAGLGGVFLAVLYALVPVAFTLFFVAMIDRWEPEPRWMYIFAFTWGAGTSVLLAVLFQDFFRALLRDSADAQLAALASDMRFTASCVAPFTEELIKGGGVLLIYFIFRRYFDGPVDGIVYGALIGAGFAFTENILYFLNDLEEISFLFHIRFLDAPFNHEAWTAIFGFFLGFARYSPKKLAPLLYMIPGLGGAIFGHWFNNDALNWPGMTYEKYLLLSNAPALIIFILLIYFARQQEKEVVLQSLAHYVEAGLLSNLEVEMIESLAARRAAQRWVELLARKRQEDPGELRAVMENFQAKLLELGYLHAREIGENKVRRARSQRREAEILAELAADRARITGEYF